MNRRGFLALMAAWLVPRWFKATPARSRIVAIDREANSITLEPLTPRQVEAWDWDRYPDGPDADSAWWGGEGRYLTDREAARLRL